MTDEIVEIMAKELLRQHHGCDVLTTWDYLTDEAKSHWRKRADNTLTALDAAGYVVVPKEPTEEMIDAGVTAETGRTMGDRITNCYRAMISARK